MGETGGFLTRADFIEQSPESEHFQPTVNQTLVLCLKIHADS
ncbi:MAG: hypothetical protein CM1200mP30_29030 [Pseudomonadota bacterium]|nr:MAG: hypothetical protein CM1200mP30_29030 [Pseudomonadota bacterium]